MHSLRTPYASAMSTRFRRGFCPTVSRPAVPKISVEAGATFGWSRWVDASIGIDCFGASGKGEKVLEHFGISPGAVADRVQAMVAELARS